MRISPSLSQSLPTSATEGTKLCFVFCKPIQENVDETEVVKLLLREHLLEDHFD